MSRIAQLVVLTLLLVGVWSQEFQRVEEEVAVQEDAGEGLQVQQGGVEAEQGEEVQIQEDVPQQLGDPLPQLGDIPIAVGMGLGRGVAPGVRFGLGRGMRPAGIQMDTRTTMRVNVNSSKEVKADGKQNRSHIKAASLDVGLTHAEGRQDSLTYNHTGKRQARVEATRQAGTQGQTRSASSISGVYKVNGTISRRPPQRPVPIFGGRP